MAGDWIKMRFDLSDDPAVVFIARALSISEDTVVGKLHRLWSWANRNTETGVVPGIVPIWVDRFVGKRGFADAMVRAGWLEFTVNGVIFPDYTLHNGESAKRRMANAARQALSRKERDKLVTEAQPKARPEKRREEKSNTAAAPTPDETAAVDGAGYTPGLAAAVATLRELGIGAPTDARLAEEFPTMTPDLVRRAVAGVKGGPGLMVTVLRNSLADLIAKRDADAGWYGKLGEVLERHRAVRPDVDAAYGRLAVWEQEDRDRKLVRSLVASVGEGSTDLVRAWVVRARRPNHTDHAAYRSLTVEMVSGANP